MLRFNKFAWLTGLLIAILVVTVAPPFVSAGEPPSKEITGVAGIIKKDVEGIKRFGCEVRLLKAGTLVAFGSAGDPDWRKIDEKKGAVRVAYRQANSDVQYYCTWVSKDAIEQVHFQCDPKDPFQQAGFFGFPWLPSSDRQNWVWHPALLKEAAKVASAMNIELVTEVSEKGKA